MNLVELKQRIDGIQPGMPFDELERTKRDLLTALEDCEKGVIGLVQPDGAHERLSKREREVMSMMLEGQRLKEIAARLDISVKTVTTHRSRLMKKLRVDDNLGLYRYGIRNRLITV
jgi:DNA-binding CsgD family transcriptional regulator